MKKLLILASFLALYIVVVAGISMAQKSAGPPACHAGEPPNNTTCAECHSDGGVGNASVTLDLGGAETGYEAGKTYTITITVSKAGMKRAGFQIIALCDQNNKISPGKITLTDNTRTQLVDKNHSHSGGCLDEERVWVEHTFNGIGSTQAGVSTWSYQWKAPDADMGAITFYMACLEANNDLDQTGDIVYSTSKKIQCLFAGTSAISKQNITVYPNPAKDLINIEYSEIPERILVKTLEGKTIKNIVPESSELNYRLSTNGMASGIYFIEVKSKSGVFVKKVAVE